MSFAANEHTFQSMEIFSPGVGHYRLIPPAITWYPAGTGTNPDVVLGTAVCTVAVQIPLLDQMFHTAAALVLEVERDRCDVLRRDETVKEDDRGVGAARPPG